MKPILILFVIILLTFSLNATGQVHRLGTKAVDFSAGRSGVGYVGLIGYDINFADPAYFKIRGYGEFGRLYNIKYSNVGADFMAYLNPFYVNEFFQFNIGAGLTFGFENVKGVSEKNKPNVGFMAGIKGGVDVEAFLSDQVGFFLFADQSFMLKKSLGKNIYDLGIGLRIFLNNYY